MTDTTKGVWHRPEAEPGAYANGYERIWGKADTAKDAGQDGPSDASASWTETSGCANPAHEQDVSP